MPYSCHGASLKSTNNILDAFSLRLCWSSGARPAQYNSHRPHEAILILIYSKLKKIKNFSSSVALAPFQVFNTHEWLVATVLAKIRNIISTRNSIAQQGSDNNKRHHFCPNGEHRSAPHLPIHNDNFLLMKEMKGCDQDWKTEMQGSYLVKKMKHFKSLQRSVKPRMGPF